jgi:hypothetical protein
MSSGVSQLGEWADSGQLLKSRRSTRQCSPAPGILLGGMLDRFHLKSAAHFFRAGVPVQAG